MNDISAVPIDEGPTSTRAVSGFSSLPKLMKMSPKSYEKFLEGPCEQGSSTLESFGMEDDLEGVLEALKRRKLGIAIVNGMVDGEVRFSLITMDDLLGLYQTRQFTSDLTVEDVSSPIFSLPAKTTVRKALTTMFRLSHRTVFISGERTYVSDRTIIDRVFDPTLLEPFHGGPMGSAFEARIGSLDRTTPVEVGSRTSLRTAAVLVKSEWGNCLVIRSREALVTPWDLVMKPWESGNLSMRVHP